MTDDEWRRLEGTWDRLKWARKRWQRLAGAVSGTAKDAADSLGVKDGTYRAYERRPGSSKHTMLDHQAAIQYGRKFKVSWEWLLTGHGTPFDDQLPADQERVLKAMAEMDADRQKALADMVETLLRTGSGR